MTHQCFIKIFRTKFLSSFDLIDFFCLEWEILDLFYLIFQLYAEQKYFDTKICSRTSRYIITYHQDAYA